MAPTPKTTNWANIAKIAPKQTKKGEIPEVFGKLEVVGENIVLTMSQSDFLAAAYDRDAQGNFIPRTYEDKDGNKRVSQAFKVSFTGSVPDAGKLTLATTNRSVFGFKFE